MSARYDLLIRQGVTWALSLRYKDEQKNVVPLTGYRAKMQIRTSYSSPTVILELNTENGRISINGSTGTISLKLEPMDTLSIKEKRGVYDLVLISPDNVVTRIMEGSVLFSRAVTRNV